jgi:type IV fimbrial biogenesis protein FimT
MELLIAIATIAVLASIGGMSYLNMRPGLRLNGASRQILSDLMAARMKAISENNKFRVFFLNKYEYKILDDDNSDNDEDVGEFYEIKNIQDNYPNVEFSATLDPVFWPKGIANPGTTVTLSNTSGSRLVKVSTAGRVKIE